MHGVGHQVSDAGAPGAVEWCSIPCMAPWCYSTTFEHDNGTIHKSCTLLGFMIGLQLAPSIAAECCLPFGVVVDGSHMVLATNSQVLMPMGLCSGVASHAWLLDVIPPLLKMTMVPPIEAAHC